MNAAAREYVFLLRLIGWATVLLVPIVVLVGNWMAVEVFNACPTGLTCIRVTP